MHFSTRLTLTIPYVVSWCTSRAVKHPPVAEVLSQPQSGIALSAELTSDCIISLHITYQIITGSLCHHVIIIFSLTYTRCITYHHTATPCIRCAHSILFAMNLLALAFIFWHESAHCQRVGTPSVPQKHYEKLRYCPCGYAVWEGPRDLQDIGYPKFATTNMERGQGAATL